MAETRIPRVLSIAGSDSGGGAGIQADLKAFAASGVHGMTAITAITAQNTVGVTAVHHVPPEVIEAQVRAVAADIGVDAVKIGMLGTVATIEAVARALIALGAGVPVVLDPVMVSESGATLLAPEALAAMVERLFPLTTVVTPNLPEARAICGTSDEYEADAAELVARVRRLGPRVSVTASSSSSWPVSATPTAAPTDRAVPIRAFSPRASLTATRRWRRPARRARPRGRRWLGG
jgi:hydroxymethylpyrimidine/phosphomethylpyrimidine kinase